MFERNQYLSPLNITIESHQSEPHPPTCPVMTNVSKDGLYRNHYLRCDLDLSRKRYIKTSKPPSTWINLLDTISDLNFSCS